MQNYIHEIVPKPRAINSTFPIHHIISGSFRSLSLFLLAFSPLHRTLSLVQHIPAFGPHQYLTANERGDRVYATSWAMPPELSSWSVEKGDEGKLRVKYINSVPISESYLRLFADQYANSRQRSCDFIVHLPSSTLHPSLLGWRSNG